MIAWVSCICPAKNIVIGALISYVVQWRRFANIQFEMKFISSYFYILYFMGFTSIYI